MSKFTASNGSEVYVHNGELYIGNPPLAPLTKLGTQAVREFFQHERDKELGRWRWPDNPDFVVYPDGTSRRVVKESTGQTMSVSLHDRKVMETYLDSYVGAARAYDAAHPEPKPWHEAVEGEVWLLMFPNSTQAWFVNGGYFQNVRTLTNINKTDPGITAGRRIWPEDSNDS